MTNLFDDVDHIMAVMAAAFDPVYGEAWTRRQVEDALDSGLCHYALAAAPGAPTADHAGTAGFYLSRHVAGEEELLLIAVRPEHRRMGVGSLLLQNFKDSAILRGARRLLLEMREDNPAAELYRAFGFRPIGLRQGYYRAARGPARNAITFSCDLNS